MSWKCARFFFEMSALMKNYKAAANWIIGPVHQYMMAQDITLAEWGITAAPLARMIGLIEEGKISHNIAIQKVFPEIAAHPSMDVEAFVNDRELFVQTSSGDISQMIDAALSKHAQKIPEYKKGKKGLISLFVGEVMKLSNGKADARVVTQKIIEKLNT
jgi:aspartyl-tRNA(Asn)/glutamyl-tRNA(Gln) amidotransferase subunit B